MRKKLHFRYWLSFIILIVLLLVFIFWNINSGSISISLKDIFQILFHKNGDETAYNIVWEIRLPRILAAVILGGALSVSGFLLQTFFGNPIAGPFVLGISSGAKLIVALTMIYLLGKSMVATSGLMILAAFTGSLISMGFVLLISRKVKQMSMLVVSGIMIGYICSAITDFVVTFADDSNIVNLHNWSLGSFSGTSWDNVSVMAVVVFTAFSYIFNVQADQCISAWRGLCTEYGSKYQSISYCPDPAFQYSVSLRDRFCRSDLLCWNCGTTSYKKSYENIQAASGYSGMFSWRRCILSLL